MNNIDLTITMILALGLIGAAYHWFSAPSKRKSEPPQAGAHPKAPR